MKKKNFKVKNPATCEVDSAASVHLGAAVPSRRLITGRRARPPVVPKCPGQREVPPATAACVRLLPRVDAGVPAQLAGRHEGLGALRAAVRLLARVRAHVRGQRPLLRKCLAAVGAVVRRDARVKALVPHQRARQREPLVAEGALVRALARVRPLVVAQLGRRVAALVAVLARKLLAGEAGHHLRVHGVQVGLEVPVAGEGLKADGAAVRPLASVRAPVQP